MAAARSQGVSPRRFAGWEPRVAVEYEFDDAGRVIGHVEYRESEYDQEDRDLLRALAMLEADTGRYGELLSEAFDADSDRNNRDAHFRYVAGEYDERTGTYGPVINHAAKAVADAQESFYEKYKDAPRSGHAWPVKRIQIRDFD